MKSSRLSGVTAAQALVHILGICFVGAFLFAAVGWIEPNRWVVIVFKCAISAAGGAAIANQLLP